MTQTTGLGIPAYVTVSGNGIVAVGVDLPISKSTPFAPQTNAFANVGQGHGASANVPVGPFPNAQYSLTLSISGATYNGVTYPSSTIAVAALLDAANNAFVGEGTIFDFEWVAKCAPTKNAGTFMARTNNFSSINASPKSGSPAYPNSNATSPTVPAAGVPYQAATKAIVSLDAPYGSYDADVVITAGAVGQAVVEVAYPFANNTLGETADDGYGYSVNSAYPYQGIVAQIVVTVVP